MAKDFRNKAYLLIGGNLGDREQKLAAARAQLAIECGQISASSPLYETAAWGLEQQPAFLNQALELKTRLAPGELLRRILKIETALGRVRKEKNGPRIIDIDILLFADQVVDEPDLKIPHPEMANRRFVLTPLAAIAPQLIHPVLKKTISELEELCTDKLEVIKIKK